MNQEKIQIKERNPLFVEISRAEIIELKQELHGNFYGMFDPDKPLSIYERQKKFAELSVSKQEIIEKSLVGYSLKTNEIIEDILDFTGKALDLSYIQSLEQKYGQKLETLTTAVKINLLSDAGFRVRKIIKPDRAGDVGRDFYDGIYEARLEKNKKEITSFLKKGLEQAKDLIKFQVIATHGTNEESYQAMLKNGELYGSGEYGHYCGKGIYTGIIGTFRGWCGWGREDNNPAKLIKLNINLADCFVQHYYRGYVANILCDSISSEDFNKNKIVSPQGIVEWWQLTSSNIDKKLLDFKIEILKDIYPSADFSWEENLEGGNYPCLIFKENSITPLEFSFLCDTLNIDRCMSENNYKKVKE